MITQLRDVRPAGQSAEVAVKHQQQPVPAVVREKMNSTATVPKFEWDGRFSRQLVHGVHHSFQWPLRIEGGVHLPLHTVWTYFRAPVNRKSFPLAFPWQPMHMSDAGLALRLDLPIGSILCRTALI